MEETVSVHDGIRIIKNRWKLIILTTVIGVIVSSGVTYLLFTPIFQATTQILVNQRDSENQLDIYQLQSSKELINTYSVIIKSPVIMNKVIEDLDLPQSIEELNKKTSIQSFDNSLVFSLIVEDQDPNQAMEIANKVSEVFQQEIKGIMNVDNVNILAKAEKKENPIPIFPKPVLNITLGSFIGILIGVGLAILLEYMDKTLKGIEDVEKSLGLPVLGTIQKIPKQISKKDNIIQKGEGQNLES